LERLSVYRLPESMTAIKQMFTDTTSLDAVEKLIHKSLLETDHKGNYWLHPLVREFAYDDLENKIEAHNRAYQYYLSLPLPKPRTKKEDVQSLIEAHHHACMADEYDKAAVIIFKKKLEQCLFTWRDYRILVELYFGMLPKDHFKDKPILESSDHCRVLRNLGFVYQLLGEITEDEDIAYYCEAKKISHKNGDVKGEGISLGHLGYAYLTRGNAKKAIEYFEKTLIIITKLGEIQENEIEYKHAKAVILISLGVAHRNLKQMEIAYKLFEVGSELFKNVAGFKQGTYEWLISPSNFVGNLGKCYRDMGFIIKAFNKFDEAYKIAVNQNDKRSQSEWLGNLGNIFIFDYQVEKAIQYYEQALTLAREIEDRHYEGIWLRKLGNAYNDLGQVEKAIGYYEQVLVIARETGDRRGEGTIRRW
jgi:tetratricopeptide (TPR) repeat protein